MKTIAGVLFVAGLCFAGCATEPEAAESTTSQDVATGVQCTDKAWRVNFWSDASQTTLVGWMTCTCFGPELLNGSISDFNTLAFERQCSIQ